MIDLCSDLYEISGAGTQLLTGVPSPINLGMENNSSSSFESSSGVVSYKGPVRRFAIGYYVSGNSTTNTRSVASHALYINGIELTRSKSYSYHRLLVDGEGTASKRIVIDLNPGDTIEVRSEVPNANDDVNILLDQSNLLFESK